MTTVRPTQIIYQIYAVIDTLAGDVSGGLLLQHNDATAERVYKKILQPGGNHPASQHPADTALVRVGQLEVLKTETGVVNVYVIDPEPRIVITGKDLIRAAAQEN